MTRWKSRNTFNVFLSYPCGSDKMFLNMASQLFMQVCAHMLRENCAQLSNIIIPLVKILFYIHFNRRPCASSSEYFLVLIKTNSHTHIFLVLPYMAYLKVKKNAERWVVLFLKQKKITVAPFLASKNNFHAF